MSDTWSSIRIAIDPALYAVLSPLPQNRHLFAVDPDIGESIQFTLYDQGNNYNPGVTPSLYPTLGGGAVVSVLRENATLSGVIQDGRDTIRQVSQREASAQFGNTSWVHATIKDEINRQPDGTPAIYQLAYYNIRQNGSAFFSDEYQMNFYPDGFTIAIIIADPPF